MTTTSLTTPATEAESNDPVKRFGAMVTKSATAMLTSMFESDHARMAAGRLALAVRSVARSSPAVYDCDPASVANCVAMCAMTDLYPSGVQPDVYLIPRDISFKVGDQWRKRKELQWQVSWRGLVKLTNRAGFAVRALALYQDLPPETDLLSMEPPRIAPAPADIKKEWKTLRGVIVVAYRLSDGAKMGWTWCDRQTIEARRIKSDAYIRGQRQGATDRDRSSPWYQWEEEMALKTGLRYAISRALVPTDDVVLRHTIDADTRADIIDGHATEHQEPRAIGAPPLVNPMDELDSALAAQPVGREFTEEEKAKIIDGEAREASGK